MDDTSERKINDKFESVDLRIHSASPPRYAFYYLGQNLGSNIHSHSFTIDNFPGAQTVISLSLGHTKFQFHSCSSILCGSATRIKR